MATDLAENPSTLQTADKNSSVKSLSQALENFFERLNAGELSPWRQRLSDRARWDAFKALVAARGVRYAGCSIETFRKTTHRDSMATQAATLAALTDFSCSMDATLPKGGGVILYGPEGTGKDHLQFALMKIAIVNYGFTVDWWDGLRLAAKSRQKIAEGQESEFREELSKPLILAISDPIPPRGDITDWNAGLLRDVLERRYQDCKSTWFTANVETLDELEPHLTPPVVARMKDESLVAHCYWPSHRKPAREVR